MTHLDTHVVVWLFSKKHRRIPSSVRRRLDRDALAVSPMVELELALLFELGRVSGPPREVFDSLGPELELTVSSAPFAAVARAAADLAWSRDPFDRLIVGQAAVDRAALLTGDETILANFPAAAWG